MKRTLMSSTHTFFLSIPLLLISCGVFAYNTTKGYLNGDELASFNDYVFYYGEKVIVLIIGFSILFTFSIMQFAKDIRDFKVRHKDGNDKIYTIIVEFLFSKISGAGIYMVLFSALGIINMVYHYNAGFHTRYLGKTTLLDYVLMLTLCFSAFQFASDIRNYRRQKKEIGLSNTNSVQIIE